MAVTPSPDFQAYLQALARNEKYQRWENSYTSTDTLGKQREFFHMGLMVQTWQPKQPQTQPGEEKPEKIERLAVLDGIRKYALEHVLLVGKPGSGKSTALERLLWEEAHKTQTEADTETRGKNSPSQSVRVSPYPPSIPVLVRLREYQTSVLEIIANFFASHDLYLSETEIDNLLSTKQLLLLMDGLNELPDDKARREVAAFRKKYRPTPMIFTTRDVSLGGDCGIEKKLEMQPLMEKQMREFVQAYLGNYSEQFLQQLSDRLRKFSETPLLLWMLCRVYAQEGKIPSNLGEAFRDFTQLYDNQLKSDVPGYENYRQWCGDLLQALAFQMMQGATRTELRLQIPKQEAEDILTRFLEREKFDKPRDYAKRWLEDLLEHHLIATVGQQKIEFQHQLVQEYYAAEYLLRLVPSLSDRQMQRDYLNYLKWTETIALVLGLLDNEAQALRVVRLALDVDLMLGARLTGEVKREFQEKTVGLVLALEIQELLKIELLGKTRSEFAIPLLSKALESSDYIVRYFTTDALGKIGTEATISVLAKAITDDDYWVRRTALDSLEKIGTKAIIPALIQASKDEYHLISSQAIFVLGDIAGEAAISELIQALEKGDEIVRNSVLCVVGQLFGTDNIPEIIQQLANRGFDVNTSAFAVIKRWRGIAFNKRPKIEQGRWGTAVPPSSYLEIMRNEATIPILCQKLSDENIEVRKSAVYLLGEIGTEDAINALYQALESEERIICADAINCLGEIARKTANYALFNRILQEVDENEDDDIAGYAGYVLEQKAIPELLPKLSEIILKGNHRVYLISEVILAIQYRAKFYNHEIYHSLPVEEQVFPDLLSDNQVINVYPQTLTMQEPTNNLNFNAPVGAVNTGTVQVKGTLNQVGTQHNYPSEQKQSLAEAAKEIQDLLTQLSLNYPTTTPAEQQQLVAQVDEQVKTNSRLRDIILAGGIELIKILCPPLGIPIEIGRKWLETAERSQ